MKLALLLTLVTLSGVLSKDSPDYLFPDDFLFGASTAALQIEGGWNEDGKAESSIEHLIHENPSIVKDQSNADIACDSYHKYKEDVRMLKELGVDFYRLSISWPRILPNGTADYINQAGIDYYNNVIDELLANDIEPYVTILHGDIPQAFGDEILAGGWLVLVDNFVDYSRVLFENFGDRVKHWMTFNEPYEVCTLKSDLDAFPPFYMRLECARMVVLAHAKTYRMYDSEFREKQNGQVSIVINGFWPEPNNTDSESDQLAAEMMRQMTYGWFADPLIYGNYPELLVDIVANISIQQGFNQSLLQEFTPEEQELMKGTIDFLGLNHYFSYYVYFNDSNPDDFGFTNILQYDVGNITPWGMKKILSWFNQRYGNPSIIITENGYSDGNGTLEDTFRIDYLNDYLYEILRAIHEDNCNVIGYSVWTLMDNFEWLKGYTEKYGLYYVDFDDPDRPRTRKMSSYVYNNIITTRRIDRDYRPEWPPSDN